MWNKSKSELFSLIVVRIFCVLWIICLVGIPFLIPWYYELTGKQELDLAPLITLLYIALVPSGVALVCLNNLLVNIRRGVTFVGVNVRYLRILSWCCFFVGVVFFLYGFYYVLALIIGLAAVFMGLVLRVVKNVFEQATAIKEENDYTI